MCWFEEPVSSQDPDGLRLLRDHGPGGLDIAAGEYGFVPHEFAVLLDVVDCLRADVTRCCGITGLLQVAGTAAVRQLDLSAHCAPAVSAHAFCAVPRVRHLEYFHDHVRVERLAFDGTSHRRAVRCGPRPTGRGSAWRSGGPTCGRTGCTDRRTTDAARALGVPPGVGDLAGNPRPARWTS